MLIQKDVVLGLLRDRGDGEVAEDVAAKLPDEVDHEEHADILRSLGLDPQEVFDRATGGMDIPTI